jgi:hypothetical protein
METIRRECCNYCMWYGPVNQDNTMRKHRPATSEDKYGRKVQNMNAERCPGSHKPFATFGCETAPTAPTTEQTTTDDGAGFCGACGDAFTARAALDAHQMETGHEMDQPDHPLNKARFVVNQLGAGYFAVRDTVTELDAATKTSRSGAQHIADCLADGTMVLDSLGNAVAAEKPVIKTSADTGEYGVFEDGECIETGFHGGYGRVAAGAAAKVRADDPANDGLSYEVKELCADHEEQPKDGCEECFADN